ncbi:MAG: hypothetical protein MUF83_03670 [Acidimicrobiales bacterium]|jgi:hypothetical protein|nr:hypothetical protein [Acidimicrobiales bacterium]
MAVVQEFRTEPVARGAVARLADGAVTAEVVADGERFKVEVADDDLARARRVLGLDRDPAPSEQAGPAWPSATVAPTVGEPPAAGTDETGAADGSGGGAASPGGRSTSLRTVLLIWLAAFLVIPAAAFLLTLWLVG